MRIAMNNFTGGEVSATLSARYDLARYKNSLHCMENFLPTVHGNVERRPGTVYVDEIGSDAILLPFSFNAEQGQNFVLVLTHKALRIANGSGIFSNALAAPWSAEHLPHISFAQVGDLVYFAHINYPLHKLVRTGSAPHFTWNIEQVELNTSLGAPGTPSVNFSYVPDYEDVKDDAGNVTGQEEKDPPTLDYSLRYKIVAVDENGNQSLPSPAGTEADAKHPSDWVVGDKVTITWGGVSGAMEYNVYREEAGYFGFIGISTGTTFIDNNYEADISDTPKEDWDPFANGNNPGVVSFHQQRMVLAATPKSPQAFYMSRIGDFENFRKSRPLQDDDPVEYLIASGNIDAVTWLASFGDLLIGTSGSEYKASGDGQAITSSNVSITAQSYWGSANLFPIIIGNSILHVQRHGARVRDLFYSLEKDGYAGNDLSIMAPHLFDGHSLRQWAYQQTPYSTIWIVRDDGVLLALTYMKEHDIWGWSRHVTQGKVRSVVSLSDGDSDAIYVVVQRTVQGNEKYFLEKLSPRWLEGDELSTGGLVAGGIDQAFFVDCGGSYIGTPTTSVSGITWLEGCAVSVLADGSPVEGCVVRNGRIALPYPARVVHVGLPYTSKLSPLPSEGELGAGTSLGQRRGYGQCKIRLHSSVGGKYGVSNAPLGTLPITDSSTSAAGINELELYEIPFVPERWGEAVPPFSGDVDFTCGGSQTGNTALWIVQDRPVPFTIGALIMDVDMGG